MADMLPDDADLRAFVGEVGQRIQVVRHVLKMTQHDLADAADLSRTSIANIEAGRQNMSLYGFARIAAALGVTPTSLLPGHDLPPVAMKYAEILKLRRQVLAILRDIDRLERQDHEGD